MKKKPVLPSKQKIPFIEDKNHIYNILSEQGIHYIDSGWKKFHFELHSCIEANGSQVNGFTRFDECSIALEICLDDQLAREIILHEYLHVMLEMSGLDEANFPSNLITVSNEQLTWNLTRQFILFKNLNPKLHSILFGE